MADNKSISALQQASQINPGDLFIVEQNGVAKKLQGQILEAWLLSFADGLVGFTVEYQASDFGNVPPTGTWYTYVPIVAQGRYLWTRITNTFSATHPVVAYSVARMGMDGSGSVRSVANISPDVNGNVTLTAEDVGAVGEGYVNKKVQKAAPKNLIDNSNFEIAQAGHGENHGNKRYAADRWVCESKTAGISYENGVLTIDNSAGTGAAIVYQAISTESAKSMSGVPHTLVVYDENWNPVAATGSVKAEGVTNTGARCNLSDGKGYVDITFFAGNENGPWHAPRITVSAGKIAKMRAICLYEGEYKDDTLPKYYQNGYEAELAECQRYYLPISHDPLGVGYSVGAGGRAYIMVPTTVTMRTTPSIVCETNDFYVRVNGTDYSASVNSVGCRGNNAVYIDLRNSNIPSRFPAAAYKLTGNLALSADL